ncbi:MAG: IS3 family transposase, partial [Bacillota bacterium]|nr:IS3 family transposase [Bacillota bacterium]
AVRKYINEGKTPQCIFLEAGFNLDIIGHEVPKRCLLKWRAIFAKSGEDGLRNDRRGKSSTGRPNERDLTIEERLRRAEANLRPFEG